MLASRYRYADGSLLVRRQDCYRGRYAYCARPRRGHYVAFSRNVVGRKALFAWFTELMAQPDPFEE
jgi:hypothetical protein